MTDVTEVVELLETLSADRSIPKNVRMVMEEIKRSFEMDDKELGVKIDFAMQKVEDISLDPNLSSYARTQIWNLTSLLEGLLE